MRAPRPRSPGDHVVIFNEAQRAWDLEKTADFMNGARVGPNSHNLNQSS